MATAIRPRQNGPFKYDVYLGFSACDLLVMDTLRDKLEQRDVLCYPKYDAARCQQNVRSAIAEGVSRSRKCLLYLSQSFIEDRWYKLEVTEVLHKAKRFSRDVIVVLKDPQLACVPAEFNEYSVLSLHNIDTLKSSEFHNSLAKALKKGTHTVLIFKLYSLTYLLAFDYALTCFYFQFIFLFLS